MSPVDSITDLFRTLSIEYRSTGSLVVAALVQNHIEGL